MRGSEHYTFYKFSQGITLEGLKKTMKHISHNSQSPDQDWKN
jgi:hypothetical protein